MDNNNINKNKEEKEIKLPPDYNEKFLTMLEAMVGIGMSLKKIADIFGVDRKTIYRWAEKYPEISHVIKKGRAMGERTIIKSLFEKAKSGNVTAMIFWLCNRDPEHWRNIAKIDVEHKGKVESIIEEKKIMMLKVLEEKNFWKEWMRIYRETEKEKVVEGEIKKIENG